MIELSRTVRFCVNPELARGGNDGQTPGSSVPYNSFAAWPSLRGMGAHHEMEVRCRGESDPRTGYLINIAEIDRSVREAAIPVIREAFINSPKSDPAEVVPTVLAALQARL